jgi:hypothetical protein
MTRASGETTQTVTVATALFLVGLVLAFCGPWSPPGSRGTGRRATPTPAHSDRVRDMRLFVATPDGVILVDVFLSVADEPLPDISRRAFADVLRAAPRDRKGRAAWARVDVDSLVSRLVAFEPGPYVVGHAVRAEFAKRYDDNGNGLVDRQEAERVSGDLPGIHFRGAGLHPITRPLQFDLFSCMNSNQNGILSRHELAQAGESLKVRDWDDNDLLESEECGCAPLKDWMEIEVSAIPRGMPEPCTTVLGLAGQRASDDRDLHHFLFNAYGGNDWHRRAAMSLFTIPLISIDANGNHQIDLEEVPAVRNAAAPLELSLDLPKSGGIATVVVRRMDPELAPYLHRNEPRIELALPGFMLTLDGSNLPPQLAECAERARSFVERCDKDGDGLLDAREQEMYPIPSLDTSGDGKISVQELRSSLEREQAGAGCRIWLATGDAPPLGTLAVLDANHDLQLSLREMQQAGRRMLSFNANADGAIRPEELPHTVAVTIGLGDAGLSPYRYIPPVEDWFVRMDRNRDGDVSRREFLGSRAQFDRLDRDGDGLLSHPEGARAAR